MDEAEMRAIVAPAFAPDSAEWRHLEGEPGFDYPIDYWYRVIDARPGSVRFVMRWAPDAYCHFHRHVGDTRTLVLAGEHHIVETTPTETVHKTRKAGHFAASPSGDVHMEHGGPAGSTVLFDVQTPDGRLFEILDADRNVLSVATIESFCAFDRPGLIGLSLMRNPFPPRRRKGQGLGVMRPVRVTRSAERRFPAPFP